MNNECGRKRQDTQRELREEEEKEKEEEEEEDGKFVVGRRSLESGKRGFI